MAKPNTYIVDREQLNKWLEQIGVDISDTFRVVIDIGVTDVVKVYVAKYADANRLVAGLPQTMFKVGVSDESPEATADV